MQAATVAASLILGLFIYIGGSAALAGLGATPGETIIKSVVPIVLALTGCVIVVLKFLR
jgi:hypothetical protein